MLYHATHVRNLGPILREGVLTAFSEGKKELVWLVNETMTAYAIAHVANRHNWCRSMVVLIEVRELSGRLLGTCWPGIYNTDQDIKPAQLGKAFVPTMHEVGSEEQLAAWRMGEA